MIEKLGSSPDKVPVQDALNRINELVLVEAINLLEARQGKIEGAVRFLADVCKYEFSRKWEIGDKINEILK